MKKTWRWAVAVVVMSGCVSTHPCENDGDCGGGGVCDQALGFCVFDPDGGTCKVSCEPFQTCQPTPAGGVCRAVSLLNKRPVAGTEYDAGAEVELEVEAFDYAGGGLSATRLPAWASGGATGPSALVKDGGVYLGTFVLGAELGVERLGVGWQSADASVGVLTRTCGHISCALWEECQPTTSGGRCVDGNLRLSWRLPADGARLGPAAAGVLGLELDVSRPDGGSFRESVPFALAGYCSGVLQLDSATGRWRATLDAGPGDGSRTLVAGWDGGPTAATRFEVVASPVAVSLYPELPPPRPVEDTDVDGTARWKKSELVPVQVESSSPLANLSASHFTNTSGVASSNGCHRACPDAGFCACFEIDLAQQLLVMSPGAISGTVTVGLNSVEDIYGNLSLPVSAKTIEVTRFKWVRTITTTASAKPTAVALTPAGTVLVGANTGNMAPLIAFRPNGQVAWQDTASYFNILSGPLVGTQGAYLGLGIPYGRNHVLRRIDLNGQSPRDACADSTDLITLSSPGLALAAPGPNEHLWTVRSASRVVRAEPLSGSCVSSDAIYAQGRTEVVVSGQEVLVGANGSSPITLWNTVLDGGTISFRGSLSTQPVIPESLFAFGPGLWGGAGDPGAGGMFVFSSPSDGGTLSGSVPYVRWQRNGGGPGVVGGTGASPIIYAGTIEGDVVARPVDVKAVNLAPDAGFMRDVSPLEYQTDHAPLLGRGGRLFVMGRLGVLRSLDTATLAQEWFWTVPASLAGPFDYANASELNLDLNRDVSNPCGPGEPGVLYFAVLSDTGTRLWAILVDSAGVDRNAPWPRAQHDPANTGNRSTDLTPYTCP